MPQMVALYNGMGGGAAAAIAAVVLIDGPIPTRLILASTIIGALIGSISLSGLSDRLGQARRPHQRHLALPRPERCSTAPCSWPHCLLGLIVIAVPALAGLPRCWRCCSSSWR